MSSKYTEIKLKQVIGKTFKQVWIYNQSEDTFVLNYIFLPQQLGIQLTVYHNTNRSNEKGACYKPKHKRFKPIFKLMHRIKCSVGWYAGHMSQIFRK